MNKLNILGKSILAIIAIGIVIGAGYWYTSTQKPVTTDDSIKDSIVGCYVANLAKDVYSLKVLSQEGESFEGALYFKNFEKDSSIGLFKGTYKDGILLGEYTFLSEGSVSVSQVVFKKLGNDFVRGYGESDPETGTHFANLNEITYDTSVVFKLREECMSPPTKDDLIVVYTPLANALIESPLSIYGMARGNWYFEASFPVMLYDSNGNQIGIMPVQAQGEWMVREYVPFNAMFKFTKPTTATGTLVFKKDNASGLPEHDNELRIPVRFK